MREIARRLMFCVLAFALGLGVALDGVQATEVHVEIAAVAANDAPMPSHCHGCGGDHAMSASACYALCGGATAVLSADFHAKVAVRPQFSPDVVTTRTGRAGPPDPYPPRPVLRS
jgi:hypothetical protein